MFGLFANWGIDYPDVGNVLDDDSVAGASGTFVNVSTGDVRDGTFWGEDGTAHEGSLEVTGDVSIFFIRRR